MVRNHIKRLAAPKTWRVKRKTTKYVARPNAGAHTLKTSVPLIVIMRDILKLVKTVAEAKHILNETVLNVDGRRVKDHRYPVGLFDVISTSDASFRIVYDGVGKLIAKPVDAKESALKYQKIVRKTIVKSGKLQLGFMDGRVMLVDDMKVAVGDTAVISLGDSKVVKYVPLQKGSSVYLFAGKHIGTIATVDSVAGDVITITTEDGSFETKKKYAYVVGAKSPEIKI